MAYPKRQHEPKPSRARVLVMEPMKALRLEMKSTLNQNCVFVRRYAYKCTRKPIELLIEVKRYDCNGLERDEARLSAPKMTP